MISFEVNDMTCGHCADTITRAIQAIDPGASVQIDLATHRVRIQSSTGGAARLSSAIQAAGYTPTAVEQASGADTAGTAQARGGCCCGTSATRR